MWSKFLSKSWNFEPQKADSNYRYLVAKRCLKGQRRPVRRLKLTSKNSKSQFQSINSLRRLENVNILIREFVFFYFYVKRDGLDFS